MQEMRDKFDFDPTEKWPIHTVQLPPPEFFGILL
jgi:hypothetical protein